MVPRSEFSYTYGHWDGRSAFLDPHTLKIRALVGSLPLLTHEYEMLLWSYVGTHGTGTYVMNGAPMTRSWIQRAALRPQSATLNMAENSVAWRTHHTLLYTPILMNRWGGTLYDSDPRYK